MVANLKGTHLKESVESTPPANKHSHHPTTHRGECMDGERLTVPASSSRLSELELKSWERKREGGSYSTRAEEEQDKNTRLHSAHAFQHPRLQACRMSGHVYLWQLMWLSLIPESYSDQTLHGRWWGQDEGLQDTQKHNHTWLNARFDIFKR